MAQLCTMEGKGLVAELQRAAICPICRGHFKDPVILDCDHSYCRVCITRYWEEKSPPGKGPRVLSCPQCKKVFERKNLRTNVKLAVEVKITQHLNAKTAQGPLAPKPRRRRGGWRPTASIQKEKEGIREVCSCSYGLDSFTTHFHLNSQPEPFQGAVPAFPIPPHGRDGEVNAAASPEFWTHRNKCPLPDAWKPIDSRSSYLLQQNLNAGTKFQD